MPRPIDFESILRDPHATLAAHRHENWWAPVPVVGATQLLSYRAVHELLGRDDLFEPCTGDLMNTFLDQNPALSPEFVGRRRSHGVQGLIDMDGEAHARLRRMVVRWFTPRTVTALTPQLFERAVALADTLTPGADFMQSYAKDFPSSALALLLGIPEDERARVFASLDLIEAQLSTTRLLTMTRGESQRVVEEELALEEYARELVARRRASPDSGLISTMLEREAELDDATAAMLVSTLLFAGYDTTRSTLGLAMLTLVDHPDVWEQIAQEPQLAGPITDELLRFTASSPGVVRRVRKEFTYRDRRFTKGDLILFSTWSANRDEKVFGGDAGELLPDRRCPEGHLAFGRGKHFCLGAHLAREEVRISLETLSAELTSLRLAHAPEMRPPSGIYGPTSLHLLFHRRNS